MHRLLLMSLLSLLLGCGQRSGSRDQYADVPLFPQTDNPACRVEPVAVDTDFFAQAFILSPDRQQVFVLTFGMAGTPEHMPYRVQRLDTGGGAQVSRELPDCIWTDYPRCWWERDGQLSVLLTDGIKTFDPVDLRVAKEWRRVDFHNFMSQKERDKRTFDEQVSAYRDALENAARESRSGVVRSVADLHLLLLDFDRRPAEAWVIPDAEEAAPFAGRFGQLEIPVKPTPAGKDDLAVDGKARLGSLVRKVLDYKINYPNIRNIEEQVLALTAGRQTARFKCTNKDGGSLAVSTADNGSLTTQDGASWLLYERQLYRITWDQ